LLRVGAELASVKSEKLSKDHIILASESLQKDRVGQILSTASFHLQVVCAALSKITYMTDEVWHSTSSVFNGYNGILPKDKKPLSYRRVSELLVELKNSGLAVSQTGSRGRHGYGSQYKLLVAPEIIGRACSLKWWKNIEKKKIEIVTSKKLEKILNRTGKRYGGFFGKSLL